MATYYMLRRDGTTVVLGHNFEHACSLWAQEQRSLVKLARPSTALGLLGGFEQCSLPLANVQVAARRSNEMKTLRSYFAERDDPELDAITEEKDFLRWYRNDRRSCAPDTAIRLFRMVWKFALQLELVSFNCPWSPLDLRKARLQAEAADVVRHFASSPLKEFLDDLLVAEVAQQTHSEPDYSQRLQVELVLAVARAALMLRKSGRSDLLVPVYQLQIDELAALRNSAVLALCRPPGIIYLRHRRTEVLASLRAVISASTDPDDLMAADSLGDPAGDKK